jgi:hypothetical protein
MHCWLQQSPALVPAVQGAASAAPAHGLAMPQLPLMHVWSEVQVVAHVPQFGDVVLGTQVPLQQICPVPHDVLFATGVKTHRLLLVLHVLVVQGLLSSH